MTLNKHIIRPMQYTDATRLALLGAEMHKNSKYAHLDYSHAKCVRLGERCAEGGDHFGVVAESSGVIVGMLAAYIADHYFGWDKIACDYLLYVTPSRRGYALARDMIDAYIAWARINGAREVMLGSTATDDTRIYKLYEHCGFMEVGRVFKKQIGA